MRFEARHRYFKRMAQQLGNFINIAFTLAMRHQRLQCHYQLSSTLSGEEIEVGPGESVSAPSVVHTNISQHWFRYACQVDACVFDAVCVGQSG